MIMQGERSCRNEAFVHLIACIGKPVFCVEAIKMEKFSRWMCLRLPGRGKLFPPLFALIREKKKIQGIQIQICTLSPWARRFHCQSRYAFALKRWEQLSKVDNCWIPPPTGFLLPYKRHMVVLCRQLAEWGRRTVPTLALIAGVRAETWVNRKWSS